MVGVEKKIIIITPRADPLTKIFSALFFVPFILKKLTMISLHFQLFNSYTNRHTMLIILEVRDESSRGTILVNDTLDFNEDNDYTFRSLIKHFIYQSKKYIVYRYVYIFFLEHNIRPQYHQYSGHYCLSQYSNNFLYKFKAKIGCCSGK